MYQQNITDIFSTVDRLSSVFQLVARKNKAATNMVEHVFGIRHTFLFAMSLWGNETFLDCHVQSPSHGNNYAIHLEMFAFISLGNILTYCQD